MKQETIWLSGWLEGEGSFMKGPPSQLNLPVVSGCSTDKDVMQRSNSLLQKNNSEG